MAWLLQSAAFRNSQVYFNTDWKESKKEEREKKEDLPIFVWQLNQLQDAQSCLYYIFTLLFKIVKKNFFVYSSSDISNRISEVSYQHTMMLSFSSALSSAALRQGHGCGH